MRVNAKVLGIDLAEADRRIQEYDVKVFSEIIPKAEREKQLAGAAFSRRIYASTTDPAKFGMDLPSWILNLFCKPIRQPHSLRDNVKFTSCHFE